MAGDAVDLIRVFAPIAQGIADGAFWGLVIAGPPVLVGIVLAGRYVRFNGSASRKAAISQAQHLAEQERYRQPPASCNARRGPNA